jgi:hypothetical protein
MQTSALMRESAPAPVDSPPGLSSWTKPSAAPDHYLLAKRASRLLTSRISSEESSCQVKLEHHMRELEADANSGRTIRKSRLWRWSRICLHATYTRQFMSACVILDTLVMAADANGHLIWQSMDFFFTVIFALEGCMEALLSAKQNANDRSSGTFILFHGAVRAFSRGP